MIERDALSDNDRLAHLRRKGVALLAGLCCLFLLLLARLGSLEIQQGARFRAMAAGELVRIVHLPAPRGRILDSNGDVLATNRPSFTASLVYTGQPLTSAEVALLQRILGIPASVVRAADAARLQGVPYAPEPLASNLTPAEITELDERRTQLPGVVVQPEPMRVYPSQVGGVTVPDLAAQVLGYIGKGDSPIDIVGKSGVEASYNGPVDVGGHSILGLAGVDGSEQVEVDALGHPVRTIGGQAPQPGDNVVLTLNGRLQSVAQQALLNNMRQLRSHRFFDGGPFPATEGAVVAMDPRTGAILALASEPTYDPNAFAQGVYALPGTAAGQAWQREWATLNDPKTPGRPLIDHALSDLSAPGSTFKPITALAALSSGVITPTQEIPCPPYIMVGNERKSNWVRSSGVLDLDEAIGRSCDTYFYRVGQLTGIDRIEAMARQFGLGQPTGLKALGGEVPGYVAGPDTQRQLGYKRPWYVTDTMDAAIGQGFNDFNVLEWADYVATLAENGVRHRPYLVQSITSPSGRVLWRNRPQVLGQVRAPAADWAAVRQAMVGVTQMHANWSSADAPFGTAYAAFSDWPQLSLKYTGHVIPVAAKTGTAEQTGLPANNGWFICYAPANDPVIAIAVYVREGDEGLLSGAPVARSILDAYYGIPGTMEVAQPSW